MTSKNKLRQWLNDNPSVTLIRFAEKIGVTGSYVTQLARDVGAPWPSREVAKRIALATGGKVTPNDLAGLSDGCADTERRQAVGD